MVRHSREKGKSEARACPHGAGEEMRAFVGEELWIDEGGEKRRRGRGRRRRWKRASEASTEEKDRLFGPPRVGKGRSSAGGR